MGPSENRSSFVSVAVAIALVAAVLAVASKNMIVDLDLFHELSLARQIDHEGRMPTSDAFAYTPTIEKVVHHEWLTGVFLYWICVKWGGGAFALVVLKYMLTIGITGGCFWYARKNGATLFQFAALAPLALLVGGWIAFTNIRAQAFTLLFLVITFHLLDSDRRGGRWWIAAWLPLVVVWANFHGGVVSGLGIIGCYGIAKFIETFVRTRSVAKTLRWIGYLIATGIATAVAINVSPYGADYVPYLIRAIRLPRPLITEWQPIWVLDNPSVIGIYLISVAVAFVAAYVYWFGKLTTNPIFKYSVLPREQPHKNATGASDARTESLNSNSANIESANTAEPMLAPESRWEINLFPIFAVMLTAYLAAKHQRHGSLFAVTWMCLVPPMLVGTSVADALNEMWRKYQRPIAIVSVAFSVIAVGFSINNQFWQLKIPAQTRSQDRSTVLYPVGPSEFLSTNEFSGNLMAPFNYAAFISWKNPNVKVSIDSRYEVAYPPGAVEESVAFYNALDGWQQRLTKYPTDAILIPRLSPLAKELEALQNAGWVERYRDQSFVLLFKKELAESLPKHDRTEDVIRGVFP